MRFSLLFIAYGVLAQPSVEIGPKIGATIPKFRLKDQHGRERDLRSIVGPKGAVLVFYRSADW